MSIADRRVAEWLFLVSLIAAAYFHAGGGWSQNASFDLTRAVVERHTFAIDAYASNSGDRAYANGHVYLNKPPGLSLVAAVPYAVLYAIESRIGVDVASASALTLNAYVCTVACCGIAFALIPALLYAAARRRGIAPQWAAFVAIAIALATELLPYATLFMFAVPSAMLMLYAMSGERRTLAGFAAGAAVAMNYLALPVLVFGCSKRWKQFAAGAALPLVLLALYHHACFGSFLTTANAHEDPRFLTPHAALGVFGAPSLRAFYGITISPYRGLFFFAPILLLALIPLVRERLVVVVTLVFFAFNVCFNGWDGGFGIGARYLVPLIPLWGLALMHARPRWLVVAVAVVSFAINVTATAVDPQPSATIPRPLTQYEIPLLLHGRFSPSVPITPPWSAATFTGRTSVNRMTYDEAIVFERHPPRSVEAEWSSFNLGEPFAGAGDARSLIPLLLLLALGGAMIATQARRAAPSSESST